MKTLLITLAAAILCVSTSPPARAQGSVSVDFFYNNLEPHGRWLDVGDYGYVWQPRDMQRDWSPYSDGRWVYTNAGWTWDSYEPYGWAVYHYGRWANVRRVGWVWVPGTEWGPAWVSWRHSSDYVGWAPLPPEARFSATIGFSSWVDDYYNIGPAHYRFVEGRHLGSTHINRSFIDNSRNVTLINETTNITNITYQDNVIYNGGPAYEEQMRLSSEPIPRYTLDRRQEFDGALEEQAPEQFQSRVEGDSFVVAAPTLVEGDATSAPATVSEKVEAAEIDRGWADEAAAEEAAAKRKERLAKAELPAGLPPEPTFEGSVDSPRAEAAGTAESRAKAKGTVQPGADTTDPRPTAPGAAGPGKAKADQPGQPGRPAEQPGLPGTRKKMTDPAAAGEPTAPLPPEPGNRSGKGKIARPDSAPAPGDAGRPGRPQPGTPGAPGAAPSSPDSQSQPTAPDSRPGKGKSARPDSPPAPGDAGRPGRPRTDAPGEPGAAPSRPDPQTQPSRPPASESRPGQPETSAPAPAPQDPAGRPTKRERNPERTPRAEGKGKVSPGTVPPPETPVEEAETEKGKGKR